MSDLPTPSDRLDELEERLRRDPERGATLVDELAAELARAPDARAAVRPMLGLATVLLTIGQAARARDLLRDVIATAPAEAPAALLRGRIRLARALVLLDDRRGARGQLGQVSPAAVMDLGAPALLAELAGTLRDAGETIAADAVDALARADRALRGGARGRLGTLARLVTVLNSGAAGTAEPLYAALRAILDESGAERGFLMLYEGAALQFSLGLTNQGRVLGPEAFVYSTTIVDRALRAGRGILIPDLAAEEPLALAASARELGLRAAACVPLRVERKRVGAPPVVSLNTVRGLAGVLYVDARSAACFGEGAAEFFEVCADCVVLAVRAARTADALRAAAAPPGGRRLHPPVSAPRVHHSSDAGISGRFPEVITRDEGLLSVLGLLERVAPTAAPVLVRGESGSGKELVARAVHRLSPRVAGPFVAVDCGSLPEGLVTHELFGHERGAFTGADQSRAGLIERASGGTLFLDEVGEMSPAMQAALLRVLQEGEVRRFGGAEPRYVDVRVVAATHRDLRAMTERGEFRQDLLFRLSTVELRIPPLRERLCDVPLLVDHVLRRLAEERGRALTIEEAAVLRLVEHAWPGNVRELDNALTRASVFARGDVITLGDVDLALVDTVPEAPAAPVAEGQSAGLVGTLEEMEQRAIAQRLAEHGWNQVQAARSLGLDRNTLRRKILRYGIARALDRGG